MLLFLIAGSLDTCLNPAIVHLLHILYRLALMDKHDCRHERFPEACLCSRGNCHALVMNLTLVSPSFANHDRVCPSFRNNVSHGK